MLGLVWRLLLLAIGGGSGYAAACYYAPGRIGPAAPVIGQALVPEPGVAEAGDLVPPAMPDCEPALATDAAQSVPAPEPARARPETLSPWDSSREPQTPAEWYRAFASDRRDDEWASAAEARIGDLIAQSGTGGLRMEYVRCAARYCAIAGYTAASNAFDSCEIGGWVGASAMFRGARRYSCIDQESAGTRRFVVFIEAEDAP